MELNLKRPIAFFDLETTGLNTTHDRIVESNGEVEAKADDGGVAGNELQHVQIAGSPDSAGTVKHAGEGKGQKGFEADLERGKGGGTEGMGIDTAARHFMDGGKSGGDGEHQAQGWVTLSST